MTAFLKSWLLGMVCAAMILALAESLVAEGRLRRLCRLAGGLVMVLAAVSPVLRTDLSDIPGWSASLSGAANYAAALEEQNDFLYRNIIAEQTAAYIADKAAEMGVACTARVTVEPDPDGTPLPAAAAIRGRWTQEQRTALSALLEQELGLDPARIEFEETQP